VAFVTPAELNEWKKEFAANIRTNPTTRKTWQEIERAGIAGETAFLLFWYTKGGFAVDELARHNRRAVKDLRIAQRAIDTAEGKRGDPRESMFVKRAQKKITAAANSPWINPYSHCETLADAAIPMGNPSLEQLPRVMAKRGEAVRRSGTTTLLRTLQLYANKHGVRLGLKRLVALAGCANIKCEEDVQNLSRFFNLSDVKGTATLILADFEHHLPKLRVDLKELFTIVPISQIEML